MLAALDALLDTTLLGYTSLGLRLRAPGWEELPEGALNGRLALVTGASSGLGTATAAGLARLGARVRLVVRDAGRGEKAAAAIRSTLPAAELTVATCDVSSLADVRRYAGSLEEPVAILVHNAGTMTAERTATAEGNEVTLATHVLGPHLMTALLRERLAAAGDARVIWVASGGMYAQRLATDDLQSERGEFNGTAVYAKTKRMQVVLADRWSREFVGQGTRVFSTHPGWADTPGVAGHLPAFRALTRPLLRNAEQGADTTVWLAGGEAPGAGTGGFWHDRRRRPEHWLGLRRETSGEREALWTAANRLCGLGG